MNVVVARRIALGFYAANIACLIWPAVLPFNRIRPLVLGMPFSMFWMSFWIVIGLIVLFWLDRIESRAEPESGDHAPHEPGRPSTDDLVARSNRTNTQGDA